MHLVSPVKNSDKITLKDSNFLRVNPEDECIGKYKSNFLQLRKCSDKLRKLESLHAIESVNEDIGLESYRKDATGENINEGLFDESI